MQALLLEYNWEQSVWLKEHMFRRMPNVTVEACESEEIGTWMKIRVPGRAGVFSAKLYRKLQNRFLNAFTEYVVLECPRVWINELLVEKYGYDKKTVVNCQDAKFIYDGVSAEIQKNIAKNRKSNLFTKLRRRIRECTDARGILFAGAFVRFRLNDYKKLIGYEVERMYSKLGGEMKYMEFISALQKLIDSRRPRISEVRVCVNDQDYTITDSRGHAIEPELYQTAKREGVDKDDLLIGLLIVAAPLRIVIKAPDSFLDSPLFSTMSNIFGDRVIVSM